MIITTSNRAIGAPGRRRLKKVKMMGAVQCVNSQSHAKVWTACCWLADYNWQPSMFGRKSYIPKKTRWHHNKLKLSIKSMLLLQQADLSQATRARVRLKWPAPHPNVGMGPDLPLFDKRLKSFIKSFFVSSECFRVFLWKHRKKNSNWSEPNTSFKIKGNTNKNTNLYRWLLVE